MGTYQGILPCADCLGIKTTIELTKNNCYVYTTEYLDKKPNIFVEKGNYTLDKDILNLPLSNQEILHLKIKENQLIYLGRDTIVNTGSLAAFYILKKQVSNNTTFSGSYKTETKTGTSPLTLSIEKKDDTYSVHITGTKTKDTCNFYGQGFVKNDTLFLSKSPKNKRISIAITAVKNNNGLHISSIKPEGQFALTHYCDDKISIAGTYLKFDEAFLITKKQVGMFNPQMSIEDILNRLPADQVKKKVGHGEFKDDLYDDYEIYDTEHKLLVTISPKKQGDTQQKINRITIQSQLYQTVKGINKNTTYGTVEQAYFIDKIVPTRTHIILEIKSINAWLSISKSKLEKGWWDANKKTIDTHKIPKSATIDQFYIWWN